METRVSTPLGTTHKPKVTVASAIRVGDIVEARILGQKGNLLTIKVGSNTLSAQLAGNLRSIPKTGHFEVVQVHPIPILKIKSAAVPANTSNTGLLARDVLPTQRPLQSLLNKVTHLQAGLRSNQASHSQASTSRHNNLKASLTSGNLVTKQSNLVSQVLGHIEKRVTELSVIVTSDGLRSALKNSGLFLENQLSRFGPNMLSKDLKAGLLQARAILSTALTAPSSSPTTQTGQTAAAQLLNDGDDPIGTLFKAVEAGIARIETLQLANHTLASNGQNGLYLEIPLRAGNQLETIQLFIEQESHKDSASELVTQTNTIYLEFKLSEDELLQAKITAQEQHLSIALWSESERIQHRLIGGISNLEKTLSTGVYPEPDIVVQAFPSKCLDPSKLFDNLLTEKA